jgi:hypothetical protein
MSFQQGVVVSGPVAVEVKKAILAAAQSRWPFIRLPRADRLAEHAHFAPPEVTDSLFADEQARAQAEERCGEVEDWLKERAERFPDVAFAFVEADCFGSTCLYRGFVCKFGAILAWQDSLVDSHVKLLDYIGITLDQGHFAPFERGYFAD